MPHAVTSSPERASSEVAEDSILPDAPAAPLENEDDEQMYGVNTNGLDDATRSQTKENDSTTRLEDMFDDDDDDDEFSSSAQSRPDGSSQPVQQAPSKAQYSEPDTLRQFYQRLFPFRPLFQWFRCCYYRASTSSPRSIRAVVGIQLD